MTTITELAPIVQTLLTETADKLARMSGFIQRQRKVTGAKFVQTLVFSHMAHPMATYHQIHQRAVVLGQIVSAQALDKRLNQAVTATFLAAMVDAALTQAVIGENGTAILKGFKGVYITDGSIVRFGNQRLKIGAMLEVQHGTLHLCLTEANVNDQCLPRLLPQAEAGQLHLRDLGFFNLTTFAQWNQEGVQWLSRHKLQSKLYRADTGQEITLDQLPTDQPFNLAVRVGAKRVAAYLVGQLTPPQALAKRQKRLRRQAQLEQAPISEARQRFSAWTLYLTNIPDLTFEQAHTLARVRWQIELLFKLWKHYGALEKSPSRLAERNRCLSYAKLLGVILQHWILMVSGWHDDQQSWVYNTGLIRDETAVLQRGLTHLTLLVDCLRDLAVAFSNAFRLSKRGNGGLTFQLIHTFDAAFP